MSVTRNFRVTVNLSSFFHDHRSRARIFINDDIQTIYDLEKRIEKIFKIKNFHLTSQNEFLPPSEDARILQRDDIVWVIQNGQNSQNIFVPDISTKKSNKELDPVSNKRTVSLPDVYVEDDLRSPKKKKKKKDVLEKSKEFISFTDKFTKEKLHSSSKKKRNLEDKKSRSLPNEYTEELQSPKEKKRKMDNLEINKESPLSKEPKKNKKKKTADVLICEEETKEIKPNSLIEKVKEREKKTQHYSSDNEPTTPEVGLNTSKNSCIKMNTLLPVLHSHINTYNKKISANNLNKTVASLAPSEITSSIVTKKDESSNEKKERYTCKGNLSQYRKYVPIPTITDKYLEQKKVNIVKIEYLTGKPETINQLGKYSISTENTTTKHSQSSENKSSTIIEDQNKSDKDISRQDKDLLNNVSSGMTTEVILAPKTANKVESVVEFHEDDKVVADVTKSEKINLYPKTNSDQEAPFNRAIQDFDILQNKDTSATSNIHKAVSRDVVSPNIETMFSASKHNSSKMAMLQLSGNNDSSTNLSPFTLKEKIPKVNEFKYFTPNSNTDLTTLNNSSNQMSTPSEVKEADQSLTKCPLNTKIILKNSNSPHHQKYFYFKPFISKEGELHNSVCSPNITNEDKSTSNLTSTKDSEVAVQKTSVANKSVPEFSDPPNETQERSTEIGVTTNCVKPTDNTFNEINSEVSNIINSEDLNDEANPKLSEDATNTTNKSLLSVSLSGVDHCESFIKDSKSLYSKKCGDSTIFEMDLTKDISGISSENTSMFAKRKQVSGVGQLLNVLRSSDSVVSVESLDSECSQFVTKRRRKRVRKRAKKQTNSDNDTFFNNSSLMITEAYARKPLNVKTWPSIHIKFTEDEEGESFKVTDVSEDRNSTAGNESFVENITIKSDLEESKLEKFQIEENDILKSPSMNNILPRIGDIIAFKVLRITENYTPEISSYITGKVVEFYTETKQVTYEILSGLEQCEALKSEFLTEVDAGGTNTSTNRREFAWVDLIDPRLLYP